MISQRTIGIPYVVKRYGCYALVLGKMVEEVLRCEFEIHEVLSVLLDAVYRQYVGITRDRELLVAKPDHLLALYLRQADHGGVRIYQIGADGKYWGWVKNKRIDYTALKYNTIHQNYHFLLGNESGGRLWNPDPTVKLADLESVIYYQAKGR